MPACSHPHPDRLYWIDWARFLAALAVVLSHIVPHTLCDWASLSAESRWPGAIVFYAVGSFGQEAVLIFFVLSGYLVGGRIFERLKGGSFDLRRYAVDRATRIYVPFLPALILSAGIWWMLGNPLDFRVLALNLLQMQGIACETFAGNGVFWTLAYEVWFYVLGGAIGAVFVLRGLGRAVAICLAVTVLALFSRLEPSYLACWLIGAASFAIRKQTSSRWLALVGLALLFASLYALSPYGMPGRGTAGHHMAFLFMSVGCGLLINTTAQSAPHGLPARLEALGTRLADSSYTLYLTHGPLLLALGAILPVPGLLPGWHALAVISAKTAFCLLGGWLLYLPFEKNTGAARAWLLRSAGVRR